MSKLNNDGAQRVTTKNKKNLDLKRLERTKEAARLLREAGFIEKTYELAVPYQRQVRGIHISRDRSQG